MTKLLHIQASPRKQRSHSMAVANEFLSAYQLQNPDHEVQTLDIWNMPLPDLDEAALGAKYAVINGENPSQQQAAAWADIKSVFDQFNQADKYALSVPMWNFAIPYRLKHYIDIITQPGMAWSYTSEDGYKGLLQNKSALVIYSSGDAYQAGTGFESYDLQKPYINLWLNFIGIQNIKTINVEATLFADRSNENSVKQQASELGRQF